MKKTLRYMTHDMTIISVNSATAAAGIATGELTNILLAIAQILGVLLAAYKIYSNSKKMIKDGTAENDI